MEHHEFISNVFLIEECISTIATLQYGFGKFNTYEFHYRLHTLKRGMKFLCDILEKYGYEKQTWNNVRFGMPYLLVGHGVYISIRKLMTGHPNNFYVYIDKILYP